MLSHELWGAAQLAEKLGILGQVVISSRAVQFSTLFQLLPSVYDRSVGVRIARNKRGAVRLGRSGLDSRAGGGDPARVVRIQRRR